MVRALVYVPFVVLWSAACYTYTPISPETVTPEMNVRLELVETSAEERVEGRIYEVGTSSLSLLPETRPGADTSPRTLKFSDVESVVLRRFNATRTLLIVGTGVAVGVGALFLADSNPGDTRGPGGSGDFNVLPMLRALTGPQN